MSLSKRVERLEERTVGDRVIVVQDGELLTVNGEEITGGDLERLRETRDVCLLKVVREGDEQAISAG